MRRLYASVFFMIAVCLVASQAKTPAALVTAFKAVLPADQKVRMAWIQGWVGGCQGRQDVYVVDSDTGVIRKVTTTTVNICAANPYVTADGSRVIYQNWNAGEIRVVNWDGTNDKSAGTVDGGLEHYWRNTADNSDWAVMFGNGNTAYRVNVDTKASVSMTGGVGDDGVRMSPDGKYVACDLTGGGQWGLVNTATGATTPYSGCSGGCVVNISPDNNYSIMHQNSGHTAEAICLKSGGSTNHDVLSPILGAGYATVNCVGSQEFESTRWVAPDYITFIVDDIKPGPFLVKISDPTKFVAVQDTLGCSMNQDFGASSIGATFLPHGPVVSVKNPQPAGDVIKGFSPDNGTAYSLNGRRLDPAMLQTTGHANYRGVVISQDAGRQTSRGVVLH